MNRDLSYFIDLEQFPLEQRESPQYHHLLSKARAAIRADGCFVLKSAIQPAALAEMQAEAASIEPLAHYTTNKVNVYFSKEDTSLPVGHPRRFMMDRSNGFVSGDCFPNESVIRDLYLSETLKQFIADCLEEAAIYHYADPIASLTMNVNKPGDQFSWHYDTNEFTVTLLIQDCEEGGVFQYAPNIRNKHDECYDDVSALLHGDHSRVKELKLNEGDLQIFKGRYALHRATEARGSTTRNLVVFTYTEKDNVIGSGFRSMELYGKQLDIHNQDRVRSDALED